MNYNHIIRVRVMPKMLSCQIKFGNRAKDCILQTKDKLNYQTGNRKEKNYEKKGKGLLDAVEFYTH